MMPDSTQSEKTEEKRATKRKASKKKEKSAKKKKRLTHKKDKRSSANEAEAKSKGNRDDGYDSDLDLDKELKPIGSYIKNREEMLEHIFKTLRGDKLNSMLPDVLKNCPLEEIKSLCLDQLEVMSKKRIRAVLAGQAMISSSGTEDSPSDEEAGDKASEKGETETPSCGKKSLDEQPGTEGNVEEICKNEDDDGDDDMNDDVGEKSSPDVSVGNNRDVADSVECYSNSVHGDSDVVDSTTDQQEAADEMEEEAVFTLSPVRDDESDSLFNDVTEKCDQNLDAGNQDNSNHGSISGPQEGNGSDPECSSVHDDSDQKGVCEKDCSQGDVNSHGDGDRGDQEMAQESGSIAEHEEAQPKAPEQRVQTRLELLELEMRARAIRSLMKANERREVTLKESQAKLQ